MKLKISVAVVLIGAALSVCPSRAADSSSSAFQTYVLQHYYAEVPTEIAKADDQQKYSNKQIFQALINGKQVRLIVDTGAGRTVLTNACARRLGLNMIDTGQSIYGIGGEVSGHDGIALVSSFKVVGREINRFNTIQVLPPGSILPGTDGEADADGLFGLDLLYLNYAILPVGGHGFLIKTGLAKAAPVDLYMKQTGFTPVPLEFSHGHLSVDGALNGLPFHAIVDYGAALSTFDLGYVKKAIGRDPHWIPMFMEGVDGRRLSSYKFTPKEMTLGSFNIPPLTMICFETPVLAKTASNAFVGFDLLAEYRAVIDAGRDILWLK
jgi:hypothetical protein